ncbi:MAG: transporter [Candidatus Thiodiazotropha sp.]|jgi:hypothetical protein
MYVYGHSKSEQYEKYSISACQRNLLITFVLFSSILFNAQANEIITTDSTEIDNSSDQQQTSQPETIGEAPDNDISHLFVRESEVLLAPRKVQLTFGVNYSSEEEFSNLRKTRDRTLSLPIVISIGVTENLESYISIPLVFTESEYTSFGDGDKNTNKGFGDILMGFSYQVLPETVKFPSMTASLKIQAPTDDSDDNSASESPAISSGYWGLSGSFSFTKSVDPAVMFFSFGFSHLFEEEKSGLNLQPGNTYSYSLGTGLSINSAISLSGRVSGSYSKELEVNGKKRVGSSNEPISFVFGTIYRISKKLSMETFVDFGLNEDANNTSFGLNYIYNF